MSDVSITFDGELSGIKHSLDDLTNYAHGIGDKIAGFGAAAFAAWGAEHVFDALKEGLSELVEKLQEFVAIAQHAAQIDAQLEAALKSTSQAAGLSADELSRMAEDLERVTTFGHDAIKTAETLILRFQNIKGDQFKQVTELAVDMAARFGGDVASAADELGRSLNNPLRGMMLLERQGVTFTQSQQEVIQALVASGQAAKAQNILLTELSRMYGGAAEAAANASGGGLKQMTNSIEDMKEKIGAKLLPVIDTLVTVLKFELEEVAKEVEAALNLFSFLAIGIDKAFGTAPAEKFVAALAVVRYEMERVGAIAEKNALKIPAMFGSKEDQAAIGLIDMFLKHTSASQAAKISVNDFREATKQAQEDAAGRASERNTQQNRTPESQIDPNLLAFTKSFPGLTANLDGLKKFGDQLSEAGGHALQDAGKLAGAIAAPLVKTFAGIGNVLADTVKPMDGFTSKLESASEMFNRIQSAAASTPTQDKALEAAQKTAEKTSTVAEKIVNVASTLLEIKLLMGKGNVLG